MLSVRDQLIFFIVEGVFVLLVNVPTVVVIYWVSRLRRSKDLIVLGGLCCADISHSMGFLTAGIMRINWMDNGLGNEITEQRNCYFYPYIIMFFVGYQFTGLMTMVVSLDRLFAVTFPIKHVSRQIKHYLFAIGLVLAYCIAGYFVAMPFQLQSTKPVSSMCYTSSGFIQPLWNYLLSFRIVTVGISVAVYIPIALKTRKIMDSALAVSAAQHSQKQKIARLNLTIGMTSISALLLLFIPDILILFDIAGLARYEVIFYIIVLNKCVVNVFIYTFRHRELRTAFMKPILHIFGRTTSNSVVVGSTDVAHPKVTVVRRMENMHSMTN
ncbi:hypothetical protein QR680_018165 [Steinernema hermaphroditum]|uniref:G-protein coupled receptors family 1 profile domain-containing protein n=1 Tax=Steinernema hermaphroditum TaxID=289476 RepID=A0AA39HJE8_9BILA|nr:hypothetical protein QR680_018165 [Steinernema hermaphroditum]